MYNTGWQTLGTYNSSLQTLGSVVGLLAFLLGRATLTVVGRVICKSYSPAPVALDKT